jgi:epoxyqueuosine reductase QueG
MSEGLINNLKLEAASCGIDTFGVCNLEQLATDYPDILGEVQGRFTHAVVFGIPLPPACLEGITDSPTLIYFHHYRQLNYILDRFAVQAAVSIQQAGFNSIAVPASQIISWTPLPRGHISHKLLAAAAGLGWWGRNNLLVTERHGSRIRFASVLTDIPLDARNKPIESRCGSCRACVASCPAHAIKENPRDFDSPACSDKLAEFSKLPFIGQRICGICVKACAPRKAT